MSAFAKPLGHNLGKFDSASDSDEVNVLGRTFEKKITHASAHCVTWAVNGIGCIADGMIERNVEAS